MTKKKHFHYAPEEWREVKQAMSELQGLFDETDRKRFLKMFDELSDTRQHQLMSCADRMTDEQALWLLDHAIALAEPKKKEAELSGSAS